MIKYIRKRDGRLDEFNRSKITGAIYKAFDATDADLTIDVAEKIAKEVIQKLDDREVEMPTVELVQDTVEETLIESGYVRVAKAYILYRAERTRSRDRKSRLMTTLEQLHQKEKDEKVDAVLKDPKNRLYLYGSEAAKEFNEMFVMNKKHHRAHASGDFYIHGRDYYSLAPESLFVDLSKVFYGGFSTNYTTIREPNSITSYADLATVVIGYCSHDLYGEISIVHFDTTMAEGVAKSYIKKYWRFLKMLLETKGYGLEALEALFNQDVLPAFNSTEYKETEAGVLKAYGIEDYQSLQTLAENYCRDEVILETKQAMESFLHQMNLLSIDTISKISIQYGLDTSFEARLVTKCLLEATESGLGKGETPVLPIQIFNVKKGINACSDDPNYDLFKATLSNKKMCYAFLDHASNNDTVRYFSDGSRVEDACGKGHLFKTSINLVKTALESKGDLKNFYTRLDDVLEMVCSMSEERAEILLHKKVYAFPFVTKEGVYKGSETKEIEDSLMTVFNEGVISVGFVGLEETVEIITGYSILDSDTSRQLALEILKHISSYLKDKSGKIKHVLNGVSDSYLCAHFKKANAMYAQLIEMSNKPYTPSHHTLTNDLHFEEEAEAYLDGGACYYCDDDIESLFNSSVGFIKRSV